MDKVVAELGLSRLYPFPSPSQAHGHSILVAERKGFLLDFFLGVLRAAIQWRASASKFHWLFKRVTSASHKPHVHLYNSGVPNFFSASFNNSSNLGIMKSINGSSKKLQQTLFLGWDLACPLNLPNIRELLEEGFPTLGISARDQKIIHIHQNQNEILRASGNTKQSGLESFIPTKTIDGSLQFQCL